MIIRAKVRRAAPGRGVTRRTGESGRAVPAARTPAARAEVTEQCLKQIGAWAARLGTPPGEDGQEVELELDPRAAVAAQAHLRALPTEKGVMKASGVSARRLGRYLAQHAELRQAHLTIVDLRRAVADTRLRIGAEQMRLGRRLVAAVRARLADPGLGDDERAQLRSDAAELLALWEELEAQTVKARAEGRRLAARTQERLADAERQRRVAEAVLDLKAGREVDEEALAEAAAAWGALGEAPAESDERRGRAR